MCEVAVLGDVSASLRVWGDQQVHLGGDARQARVPAWRVSVERKLEVSEQRSQGDWNRDSQGVKVNQAARCGQRPDAMEPCESWVS